METLEPFNLYRADLKVGPYGVEGRIQVDEVHAGVGYVSAQDVQVVPEEELVFPVRHGAPSNHSRRVGYGGVYELIVPPRGMMHKSEKPATI